MYLDLIATADLGTPNRGGSAAQYQTLVGPETYDAHLRGVADFTNKLFSAVARSRRGIYFVAVENNERIRRGFKHNSILYRAMYLDLIATAVSALNDKYSVDNIQIVLSRADEMRLNELLENAAAKDDFERMVESGLVTLGLFRAADKRVAREGGNALFRVLKNRQHPLLRMADFVSNVVYRREYPIDIELFEELRGARDREQKLFFFPAFTGIEERRAQVAERDGDLVSAAIRWAQLRSLDDLQRVVGSLRHGKYLFSARYAMEELIERLDRNRTTRPRTEFLDDLAMIEKAYQALADLEQSDSKPELLFRLRSYMLVQANHFGLWETALALIENLRESESAVATNFADYGSVLRLQVAQSEFYVNALEFDLAYEKADAHLGEVERLEQHYKDHKRDLSTGSKSAFSVRAKWNAWRCDLLRLGVLDEGLSKLINHTTDDWM
jgi:hypothetical protein